MLSKRNNMFEQNITVMVRQIKKTHFVATFKKQKFREFFNQNLDWVGIGSDSI